MKPFRITAKESIKLERLLQLNIPDSWSAKSIIEAGGVWLDRKKRVVNPELFIPKGMTVTVYHSTHQGKKFILKSEQIIFENNDLMVVYKPNNLNVHPVPASLHYNLNYGVNAYLKKGGIRYNSQPITRLDKPVEGLVIFPKNKTSEIRLFKLSQERRIRKWYYAALESARKPKYLRINDRVASNGVVTEQNREGKKAETLFIRKRPYLNFEIFSIFIFTGRRHQIRFHASNYLGPIVGDRLYGSNLTLKPDTIALICRGYNIPWKDNIVRVRIPEVIMDKFFEKLKRVKHL